MFVFTSYCNKIYPPHLWTLVKHGAMRLLVGIRIYVIVIYNTYDDDDDYYYYYCSTVFVTVTWGLKSSVSIRVIMQIFIFNARTIREDVLLEMKVMMLYETDYNVSMLTLNTFYLYIM